MKLKRSIKWLVACSTTKWCKEKSKKTGKRERVPYLINMATLTFHENMQDDNQARQCLSRWIEMAKYRFQMRNYIWKGEPQERGAIHFHLSTNVYIPHSELKYTWNRELAKFKLNAVEDNSTDIHAVIKVKNHEAYLTEYFMNEEKHEGRRKIKGRLWGCSHPLSQAGKEYILLDKQINEHRLFDEDKEAESLFRKFRMEDKPIPDWLKFADMFLIDSKYYHRLPECELKQLYANTISQLQGKPKQIQYWP